MWPWEILIRKDWGPLLEENAYVNLLEIYFKETAARVVKSNYSISGNKSGDLLAMLLDLQKGNRRTLSHTLRKADVITLSIGGNNLLNGLL
jgi:lysophospholipase L1-like esterase